jgi:dTDP-4-dehydrorhamnose reductase
VVVHLAAYTNVDECEARPDRAFNVNAQGTRNVARAAARSGARVVYVSTDYVFDGTKEGEYVEGDDVNPINVYGRSKAEGEDAVSSSPDNLVVRTSWVFGRGRNFVATILAAARAGNDLRVVGDQIGRPTSARDLARSLAHLVGVGATGTVHVAGDGEPCSWADLAEEAIAAVDVSVPVERVMTDAYERASTRPLAPRPRNSTLALERARSWGVPLRDWRDAVRAYVGGSS